MKVVKLDIANMKDWFDFFDSRAFADHKEWNGCYCTYYFYPKHEEYKGSSKKREYAQWLIENRKMTGYLAYDGAKTIGWCNIGEKILFPKLMDFKESDNATLSIVCFIVQKEYRGKGIAHELLKKVIDDAKVENVKIIEAYPNIRTKNEYSNYHGALSMYRNAGFIFEKKGNRSIVRKFL